MDTVSNPEEIIAFWRDAGPQRWFTADESFDARCRDLLAATYERAAAGDLAEWETSPEGALALVILLDQIPRNIFRGDRRTWATDPAALSTAERAIDKGYDREVPADLRPFLYLPFMHAEDRAAQERSLRLYEAHGDAENLKFAHHHRDIVARFGRFPHRNAVLGRETTAAEHAFLETDAFRG